MVYTGNAWDLIVDWFKDAFFLGKPHSSWENRENPRFPVEVLPWKPINIEESQRTWICKIYVKIQCTNGSDLATSIKVTTTDGSWWVPWAHVASGPGLPKVVAWTMWAPFSRRLGITRPQNVYGCNYRDAHWLVKHEYHEHTVTHTNTLGFLLVVSMSLNLLCKKHLAFRHH